MSRLFCALALAWASLLAGVTARAQDWPRAPVHIIVPLAAGSAVDINARLMGAALSKKWGQPVIIDNRPGGDTLIAIQAFIRASDDHTLYYAPTGTFTMHPYVFDSLPYDAERDFTPIARVSKTVVAIVTPHDTGPHTLAALIDAIRAKPGDLTWSGSNSIADFVLEGYLKSNGLEMRHVPYRDLTLAIADVAATRLSTGIFAFGSVRSLADAGKLDVLAVVTHERAPAQPDIPTVAELGYPGLTIDGLVGLFGPRGFPEAARDRIAADIRETLTDKTIADQLNASAQIVDFGGPADFSAAIADQRVTAAKIAAMGVKARR